MLPRIVLDSAVPIATRSGKMEVSMVEIQPIRVEIEREEDGRILASVPDLPGVMAYGSTEAEAIRKVKSIALQGLADMIESGEDVPGPMKVLFAAWAFGAQPRPRGSTPPCCVLDGRLRSRSGRIESSSVPGGRISRSASMTKKKSVRRHLPRSQKRQDFGQKTCESTQRL